MSQIKKNIISIIIISLAIIMAMSLFAGCSTAASAETTSSESAQSQEQNETSTDNGQSGKKFNEETLTLTGSTTLLEVAQMWAESFMDTYGGKITVNGGGSGEGIASLLNGTTDLANASRAMKEDEFAAAEANGQEIKEYIVLFDGICVITSKNIDVKELSIEQLSDIFTGKITNWSEVGGPEADIVAAARDTNSGTGEYFLERVVQKNKTEKDNDYSDMCLRLQSNSDVVNQVAGNENTIGYIGIGFLESAGENINLVAVKDDATAVLPSIETVADKSYPIARDLYIYGNSVTMTGIANAFMEFVLSADGQALGQKAGFVGVK
ncbi:MAG: PstS family phosphate ABC transporter substrate-binding protein [Actinomycetota bacterium]|nr:PstS family phosphate ABC transporter substrate-binding protein [Actinomycetota bacterium]